MNKIKLIIYSFLVLMLVSCGDAVDPQSHRSTYDVTCYSGGQKILELKGASEHSYGNNWRVFQVGSGIETVVLSSECILVKN